MIIPCISPNISIYKRSPNHESCYLRRQSTALWNHLLHSQGFTGKHFYQSVKDSLAFMKLVHHKEVESWAKLSLIFSWIFLQPFIPILQSFIFPDGSFLWGIKSHCFSCFFQCFSGFCDIFTVFFFLGKNLTNRTCFLEIVWYNEGTF